METTYISSNNLRKGLTILQNNEIYTVLSFQHVKIGRGDAFIRSKLKSLDTGSVLERTFRAGEKVSQVIVRKKEVTYLYFSDGVLNFMDMDTGEELTFPEKKIREEEKFMKEGNSVTFMVSGEDVVGIQLPNYIDLTVTKTEPGVKGNTVSGGSKPAQLETGLTLQVPLFIREGDTIRVDTRDNKYVERVG